VSVSAEICESVYERVFGDGVDSSKAVLELPWSERQVIHSREFKDYAAARTAAPERAVKTRSEGNSSPAAREPEGEASPHMLLAIPRALAGSQLWRDLGSGPRDLYQYLLARSNTRSFKDVFPGAETIERDLNLDKRTRRRYERALVEAKILRIVMPGERDDAGNKHMSRRFAFPIVRYINADRRAYNESKGKMIYPPLKDMSELWREVERYAAKIHYNTANVKRRSEIVDAALDQLAKRLQITGTDHLGRVHIVLHSRVFEPSMATPVLPENVLLFPDKKNKDLIINDAETWRTFEKKIYKALADAAAKREAQPLLDFMSAANAAATKKAI